MRGVDRAARIASSVSHRYTSTSANGSPRRGRRRQSVSLQHLERHRAAARLLVHRGGHVDDAARGSPARCGTIMFTFVVMVCVAELELVDRRRQRPQLLDLLARCRRTAPGSGRPSRTSASCPTLTCGRSTCRTSSSACDLRMHLRARRTGRPARSCCRRCSAACAPICTTPSPVRLIASAGQTSAQVGCSQCMQTTGTVCVDCRARSTYSRWIIDSPLCVSHSVQACTQAWQPMQRFGSMKNCRWSGLAMLRPCLLLRLERRGVVRRRRRPCAPGTAHTLYSGIFEIGSCAAIGQLVGALRRRPSGTGRRPCRAGSSSRPARAA